MGDLSLVVLFKELWLSGPYCLEVSFIAMYFCWFLRKILSTVVWSFLSSGSWSKLSLVLHCCIFGFGGHISLDLLWWPVCELIGSGVGNLMGDLPPAIGVDNFVLCLPLSSMYSSSSLSKLLMNALRRLFADLSWLWLMLTPGRASCGWFCRLGLFPNCGLTLLLPPVSCMLMLCSSKFKYGNVLVESSWSLVWSCSYIFPHDVFGGACSRCTLSFGPWFWPLPFPSDPFPILFVGCAAVMSVSCLDVCLFLDWLKSFPLLHLFFPSLLILATHLFVSLVI